MRITRSVALPAVLGLGAAIAATVDGIALAHGAARASSTPLAVATIVAGCTFVAAGIVAWLHRRANQTGVLMMATGFLLLASSLAQIDRALPFTVGLAVGALPAALLVHLVLAFPDGRLHSRAERLAVAVAYVDVTVGQVVMLMFMGFENVHGCPCPSNLLLVRDDMRVHSAIMGAQRYVGIVLAIWIIVLVVARWRSGSGPMRRLVVPLTSAAVVTIGLYGASSVTNGTSPGASRALGVAAQIALAAVPLAFLLGVFGARLARAGVSDLVVELERMPAPGRLRDALSRALGDPSLELAYWIPETQGYVGVDGRPTEVRAGSGRDVTLLERGGHRVAAIVHDAALTEQPELLDGVSAAASLALENERLQAELRAQLEELRASRARIVEAGDLARRRLERNLHDGAQQRLVALSVALGLAQAKLEQKDTDAAAAVIADARGELSLGLAELREIARGLHPAVIGRGLKVALTAVAERSPVPVDLELEVEHGLDVPEQFAATAYYVVSEALTNVARYAEAGGATVRVTRDAELLRVEIADDGVGGAAISTGTGLEGLRDRVEAVGGRLELDSPAGGGTRLTALLPVAADGHDGARRLDQ